tara:strand:- start:3184 stop:3663 length:480 start_codon:yes stop_codon:yes gene_type:complete
MGFLDDYVQNKRGDSKSYVSKLGLLLVGAGLGVGYLSSSGSSEQESVEEVGYGIHDAEYIGRLLDEPLEKRNLRALDDFVGKYQGLVSFKDDEADGRKSKQPFGLGIVGKVWENMPAEEQYKIMKEFVGQKSKDIIYDLRDYGEENIDEIMFFLLGGGS